MLLAHTAHATITHSTCYYDTEHPLLAHTAHATSTHSTCYYHTQHLLLSHGAPATSTITRSTHYYHTQHPLLSHAAPVTTTHSICYYHMVHPLLSHVEPVTNEYIQRLLLTEIKRNHLSHNKQTHIPWSQIFHATSDLEGKANEILGSERLWVWAVSTCTLWRLRMQWVDVVIADRRLMTRLRLLHGVVQSVHKAAAVLYQIVAQTAVSAILHDHI